MIEWGRLRIGVDILPATDPKNVPHCREPGYRPNYRLEIQSVRGEWTPYKDVPIEELPEAVDRMHLRTYKAPVRLVEDGYPVFACF